LLLTTGGQEEGHTETIRAMATTALVFSLPFLLAGFGWLQALAPLPVYYYVTLFGFARGSTLVVKALGIAALVALFSGALPALLFSLTILPLGLLLARSGKRQESAGVAAGKGALYLALAWLLGGWLLGLASQTSLLHEIRQNLDAGFATTLSLYEESGSFSEGELQEIRIIFSTLQRQVIRLLPGLLLSSILCLVWGNIVLGQWLLRRKDAALAHWGEFKEWRLPDSLVWGVVLTALALIFPDEALHTLGLNLGLVLLLCYLSQGLAVLASMLHRWSVPRLFRGATYLILLVQIYGIVLLSILGLADVWLDIRKRLSGAEKE
jgi:uncharacterized protein YybS (DUF2232 family)